MPTKLAVALLAAVVTVLVLMAVCTALLVDVRNDMDATADAILLQAGTIANGIWLAVHSEQRPVLRDGRVHHSAAGAAVAAPTTTTAAQSAATTTTVRRTTTTRRPTTTTAAQRLVIEDFYLASDGETYFVEVSGVMGATYCEAQLTSADGRRTGEWSNELLTGSQDRVTISLWDHNRTARADAVEVECSR